MSLSLNSRKHWQLPDGFELRSGDPVELLLDGKWLPGEIYYHPQKLYQVRLENGQVVDINAGLELRVAKREWMKQVGPTT
jgi:hypothetical protein